MTARLRAITGRGLRLVAVAVGMAVAAGSAGGKDRPAQKVTPQLLDALARQYRDAGLPLPPPDAPLMLAPSNSGSTTADGKSHALFLVGFQIKPDSDNAFGTYLMGTQERESRRGASGTKRPPSRLEPAQGLPTDVWWLENWADLSVPYPVNDWLALAVQCHLRGYHRMAEQIFARGLVLDPPDDQRLTSLGDGNPRDALAATAWNYWMDALCATDTDRQEILAHLEKLAEEFPALDGPFQREFLASLRQAMVPGKGTPGSVEALIDTLVDHTGNTFTGPGDTNDPNYVGLQTFGFEAVPVLITHLVDRRLTRSVAGNDRRAFSYPRRVDEVASDLIVDIAGKEMFPNDLPAQRPLGQPMAREVASAWWAKASAIGEEKYFASQVFPPTEASLRIVSERHPQCLEAIYARVLKERPAEESWLIARAISACGKLGRQEQIRILREGVDCPNLPRVQEALYVLEEFGQNEVDTALAERFAHWPADIVSHGFYRPEATISRFVIHSDSAVVWDAFERALWRATPALRMEMLGYLVDGQSGQPQDVRRLALLDLFLDDEEVRVIHKEDQEPGGLFEGYKVKPENRKISVGNFATGLLGNLLNVKPPPGTERNERWWAKYRADARSAIDRQARAAAEAPADTQ